MSILSPLSWKKFGYNCVACNLAPQMRKRQANQRHIQSRFDLQIMPLYLPMKGSEMRVWTPLSISGKFAYDNSTLSTLIQSPILIESNLCTPRSTNPRSYTNCKAPKVGFLAASKLPIILSVGIILIFLLLHVLLLRPIPVPKLLAEIRWQMFSLSCGSIPDQLILY